MIGRSRRISRAHRRQLVCDGLEPRRLLAGTPATFFGTDGDDQIDIFVSGANMVVRINGTPNSVPAATTESITVFAQGGRDIITVDGTLVPLDIRGEGGRDDLILTEASGRLSDLAAGVAFDGGAGDDFLQLWDDLTPANASDVYTFGAGMIQRNSFPQVTYALVEDFDLRAGPGTNTIIVNGISPGVVNFDLYGGGGDDTFELATAGNDLDALVALVEVHGELGSDSVILHDAANSSDHAWTITEFTVGRAGWAGLRYNTIEALTLHAGAGADSFAVESTRVNTPVVINAGDGNDLVHLAPTSSLLDDIVAPVTVNGQTGHDQLLVYDTANSFGDTFEISDGSVARPFFGGASYSDLEGITLRAGSGVDTMNIQQSSTLVSLSTGAGNDIVNVAAAGPAHVTFIESETLGKLTIADSGLVTIAPASSNTLVTAELIITGTGTLDITDNAVVVDWAGASPLETIRTSIAAGYNGGAWTGSGITSSTAAATPQHAVGYAEASDLFSSFPGSFAGVNVDGTSVLLRYTRYGDANLDRAVNLADFNRLAGSFGAGVLWSQGNFNFDTTVSLSDFNLLAANFGQSAASLTS